ncbi:hypothetical protein V2J09_006114 [Rumex salicifolius]
MVYFRCYKEQQTLAAIGNHITRCADDTLYGPYPADGFKKSPPSDCTGIFLPNSTDDNFFVKYQLPDECSRCALDMSGCVDHNTGELKCPTGKGKKKLAIKIASAASLVGMLVLISTVLFLVRRASKDQFTRDDQRFETFLESYGSLAPKRYTYSQIQKITNSFKEKLGEGGFGGVYKGKLVDGRLVAVKMLKESKGNGEDFINEVASISGTSHINIVTLLGFCCVGRKRALVYEFMAKGSLEKFINGKIHCDQLLQLDTLFDVALGIARGLHYLHQGCKTRILHFDIKPHNILLDEDFCPKIYDFGLAKVSQQNKQSKVSMSGIRGTIGYIAPEMFCRHFGDVSYKADVYSYGMMVLEIIGSRRRQGDNPGGSSEIVFPQWIYEQLEHGDDQNLNDEEKVLKKKMILVSLWCIQTVPSCRPSMSSVLQMLEGSVELLQIPPMPSLSSPPRPQFDPSGSSIVTLRTESLGTSS